MFTFPPTPLRDGSNARHVFADTFRRQIAAFEAGRARVRIPQGRELYVRRPCMAYHFKPEIFFQLAGSTEFACPGEQFTLKPDEICIMPRGVPHGEVALPDHRPFENVVVCFYNETVAIHVAHEVSPGVPGVDDIHFYPSAYYDDLVELLNRVGELRWNASEFGRNFVNGLLMAVCALLFAVVKESVPQRFSEIDRIAQCQWLIRNNLDNPELGVAFLARHLRYSPGHLSKLFQEKVGEKIVEYISRLRLQYAMEALRTTKLSVKEVAAACGYEGANYFGRMFRLATGVSPQTYREKLKANACVLEQEPKTVFFDREDFRFATPPTSAPTPRAAAAPA